MRTLLKWTLSNIWLLLLAVPATAQTGDPQSMLDQLMKSAPPELRRNMEAEIRRQREGRPEPVIRGGEEVVIDVPPGSVDIEKFLAGYWVSSPFKVDCDKGRPEHGPYIHGKNMRFEIRDNEIWQYDRTWGGPGYNFTYRTRYRIRDIERTVKNAGPYAKQLASISVDLIDTKLIDGRGSPTGPRFKQIDLMQANNPYEGFKGRQAGQGGGLYSCEGEFLNYDREVAPTQGVGR